MLGGSGFSVGFGVERFRVCLVLEGLRDERFRV